jgi:hypothetical protein
MRRAAARASAEDAAEVTRDGDRLANTSAYGCSDKHQRWLECLKLHCMPRQHTHGCSTSHFTPSLLDAPLMAALRQLCCEEKAQLSDHGAPAPRMGACSYTDV